MNNKSSPKTYVSYSDVIALGVVPKDLGGFQAIAYDHVRLGDLLVFDDGVVTHFEWAYGAIDLIVDDHQIIDTDGTPITGVRCYRKMKVAKQGDNDARVHAAALTPPAPFPAIAPTFIPTDSARRKGAPMFRGLIGYFPGALFLVAEHSRKSNDKHNPGQELHWARDKSSDHLDCVIRHAVDAGDVGTPNRLEELTALAWRSLAALQEEAERQGFAPGFSARFNKAA